MIFGKIFNRGPDEKVRAELKELGRQLKGEHKDSDKDYDDNMGRQETDKRWLHREKRWDIKKKIFLGKMDMLGRVR